MNIKFKLLLSICFMLILSACSEFLNGKPVKEDYVTLKNDSLNCLNDVSADVQKFFNSASTSAQIDKTFTCLDNTLSEFQTRVQGRAEASSFNAAELYDIFQKFIKEANVSREAAKSFLLLKAAVFGGDSTKITKAEITELRKYLGLVKIEAKALQPFLKLYIFEKPSTPYTKKFINDGFAQLNLSIKNLYRASKFSSATYSFNDFKNLIINLNVLKENQNSLVNIANKLNAVLNGTSLSLAESDRLDYIDNITEVLRLYSIYSQGSVRFDVGTLADLNTTFEFLDSAINLIENSLQYRRTRMITAATIDPLLTEIFNSKDLPIKLSATDAIKLYKTAVVRVFETGVSAIPTISGITRTHIVGLKREIAVFKIYSKMIEKIAGPAAMTAANVTRLPISYVQQQLRSMPAANEVEILNAFDAPIQANIIQQVEEMKAEFLQSSPVIYRFKKMVVAANQNTWDQNWEDLQVGVYNKFLARLLLVGWGVTPSTKLVSNAYAIEQAMVKWYSEFKSFGIALKFLDPRIDNLGSGNFAVGNLFTRAGNGDNKLSFNEAIENLGELISAGQTYADMRTDLETSGCQLPELDVFGQHWNNEACFYTVIRKNYKYYFASMSYLVAYLNTLPEVQFKSFFEQLIDIARTTASNKGKRIESSDITGMNNLLYFMETTYFSHDLNRNWSLAESEIKQGYPKFQSFATTFARKTSAKQIKQFTGWEGEVAGFGCFNEADLIRESFVFLVYNGRTPELDDFHLLPCFRGKPLIKFLGEVDRMRILNAFKVIKSALGA